MVNFSTEVSKLITVDLMSLIPVQEAGEKKALVKWRNQPKLDPLQLFDLLDKHKTNGVAVVLGNASQRMVCIDVDTKYNAGFDAQLFADLKQFYPELLERFRIEKTPSGGIHLLYRVGGTQELPGCPKLASREATNEELIANPKERTKCFLELKCEGGLTHVYPTKNYIRHQDVPIPELTWEEHSSILAWCRTYNQVAPKVEFKTNTKENEWYSTNPYEDFDRSEEGANVLKDNGWEVYGENADFVYYMRPDKKVREVSAFFQKSKVMFKIYSTKTELETKSYSPSNLACELMFGVAPDAKKQLYQYLVAKGYGKLKPSIEKNIVKNRAQYGGNLPANISSEARFEYEMEKARLDETYPYGIFWEEGDNGGIHISREDLYRVAHELGFRKHAEQPVYIYGYVVKLCDVDFFYDELKKYIKEDNVEIYNAYEAFLQNSGKFTITRLTKLDKATLLKSTKQVAFKFFRNCYIRITKDTIEEFQYGDLQQLVWEHDIKDREFKINRNYGNSLYVDFLKKALGFIDDYTMQCIGFYAHDFRDQEAYMVITTETVENHSDGGGSGKNIFWNLFAETTTQTSIPASQVKKDNTVFQSWNYERVLVLADMPKNFDLIFFKEIINGTAEVNKKYVNAYKVPLDEMPKLGGSTNYSFDDTDGGLKRRIRPLEFTSFLLNAEGVKEYYKKMFPLDWDEDQYNYFDNFMIDCVQVYFKHNNNIARRDLSEGGWIKQFEQKYNHLHEYIKQNLDYWLGAERVKTEKIKDDYILYCNENNVKMNNRYSMYYINKAINDYCEKHKIETISGDKGVWRENNQLQKGRLFPKSGSAPKAKDEDDVPF